MPPSGLYSHSFLSLELPPTPLFKDEAGGNVIPQVPLYEVLQKFDGVTKTVRRENPRLPRYYGLQQCIFWRSTFPACFVECLGFPARGSAGAPCLPREEVPAFPAAALQTLRKK